MSADICGLCRQHPTRVCDYHYRHPFDMDSFWRRVQSQAVELKKVLSR